MAVWLKEEEELMDTPSVTNTECGTTLREAGLPQKGHKDLMKYFRRDWQLMLILLKEQSMPPENFMMKAICLHYDSSRTKIHFYVELVRPISKGRNEE